MLLHISVTQCHGDLSLSLVIQVFEMELPVITEEYVSQSIMNEPLCTAPSAKTLFVSISMICGPVLLSEIGNSCSLGRTYVLFKKCIKDNEQIKETLI